MTKEIYQREGQYKSEGRSYSIGTEYGASSVPVDFGVRYINNPVPKEYLADPRYLPGEGYDKDPLYDNSLTVTSDDPNTNYSLAILLGNANLLGLEKCYDKNDLTRKLMGNGFATT